MANVQKIVDDLSKLTVFEAAELAMMLKDGSNDGSAKLFDDQLPCHLYRRAGS
jgi:hypothetical protein